jgi:sugar phosphate permease
VIVLPDQASLAGNKPGLHYGYVIISLGTLIVVGALGFGRFGYTMIFPVMQHGLRLNYTEMGLLATGNFIGYLFFSFMGGILASRYGPKLVITYSLFLAGLAMIGTGFAQGFALAFLMRIITGMGSGGSNVPMMGLASSWFGPQKRGMATGLMVGGSGIGLVLTGLLLPRIFIHYGEFGWRLSWYLLGGAVILIGFLALKFLINRPGDIGLQPVGGEEKNNAQEKVTSLQWSLVYRSKTIWHLASIYVLFGFSYIIYSTFFAAYLLDERGLTESAAGNLWALVGVLSIFSGLLWGIFSDHFSRRAGLLAIFSLQFASFLVFSLATGYGGYLVSSILFGLTAWSIPGLMAASVGDHLGSRLTPAGLGMITLVFGMGQALAPGVSGYLTDLTASFTTAFLLASCCAFLGVISSFFLKLRRSDHLSGVGS